MPTLAWGPGDPLTPYHIHSFIRLDHILTPNATPCHDHYQPRHLPQVVRVVGLAYDHHGDFERHSCVDLIQDTVAQVSSFEKKTEPLREEEFWFWLGVEVGEMAAYNTTEDSELEYYNVTLLEHTHPTATLPPSPPTSTLTVLD